VHFSGIEYVAATRIRSAGSHVIRPLFNALGNGIVEIMSSMSIHAFSKIDTFCVCATGIGSCHVKTVILDLDIAIGKQTLDLTRAFILRWSQFLFDSFGFQLRDSALSV
jgi:hypothetical protein